MPHYDAVAKLAAAYLVLLDLAIEPGYKELAEDVKQGIALVMVKIRKDEAERDGPLSEEAGLDG